MAQNYLAHTCKCVPGLACSSSSCSFADKLTGLSALSHDVFRLKDRIWLNDEITNAAVELSTAGLRTQDAAFRCHIPVCLMEAAVSICLQTARCTTVLKISTAVCRVSSRGTCILFGLATISCMSHNKVQLDMQL